jgi:hypothetical protein
MFLFNLRKDIINRNTVRLVENLRVASYIEQQQTLIARNFINRLVDTDIKTTEVISTKADVTYVATAIENQDPVVVTETLIRNTLDTYLEEALNSINSKKETSISEIDNMKTVYLEEITDKATSALSEINILAENVANQLSGLNNVTNQALLDKINYLFHMFYHSDSEEIMDLYPM